MDSLSGTNQKTRRANNFFVLGNPQVYGVFKYGKKAQAVIDEFVRHCESAGKPAFISLFEFRKGDTAIRTVDRDSAVVDRIKFDIDGSSHATSGNADALAELRRLMDWCDNSVMDYEINFSGSDGFGFLLKFPEAKVKNAYKVVSSLYERFTDLTKVGLDGGAMNGTQQKFRIVNSKHQKSGLYAIPLTKQQARTLTMPEIKALAVEPRQQVEFCDIDRNFVLREVCEGYDRNDGPREYQRIEYEPFLPDAHLRPCTRYLIENKIRGWVPMSIVAFELIAVGQTDEQIHNWSKNNGGQKYDPNTTQYHIDIIRRKMASGDLFVHGCNAIKRHGFCVNGNADTLTDCRDFERLKAKVALKRKLLDTIGTPGTSDLSSL